MKTQKLVYKFSELLKDAQKIAAENIAGIMQTDLENGYNWCKLFEEKNFYTKDGELVE